MPFIGNIGAPELIIVLVIALLVLGPGKLPEVGNALGKGLREFRKAATDVKDAASIDPVVKDAPKPNVLAGAAPANAPVEPPASTPEVPAAGDSASDARPEAPAS